MPEQQVYKVTGQRELDRRIENDDLFRSVYGFYRTVQRYAYDCLKDIPHTIHKSEDSMPRRKWRPGGKTEWVRHPSADWYKSDNRIWDGEMLHIPERIYVSLDPRAVFLLTHELAHYAEAAVSDKLSVWNYGLDDRLDVQREVEVLKYHRGIYQYVDSAKHPASNDEKAKYWVDTDAYEFRKLVASMGIISHDWGQYADKLYHWGTGN